MMIFKSHFYIYAFLSSIIMLIGCADNDMPIKDKEEEKPPITDEENLNPEKPDVPLNKNDAFQKVQKRRVQEKR